MRTILSSCNNLVAAALVTLIAGCSGSGDGNSNPEPSNVGGGSSSPSGGAATGGKTSGISTGGASSSSNPATGGSSSTSAASGGAATGGRATGGAATGGAATGGAATGGSASGGAATGGKGAGGSDETGGKAAGGSASGGAATGGKTAGGGSPAGGTSNGGASGGVSATGGAAGGGTASDAPVPSKGCSNASGKTTLLAGGTSVTGAPTTSTRLKTATSGGKSRLAIIDIPADYDPAKPYRLVFSWRQMGGSDTGNATGLHPAGDGPNFDAKSYAYFGLRREALNANQPAIFIAPDTDPAGGNWDWAKDSVYFDDLFKLITDNLCIDESRVFATGFSFGAMMSYALSVGRATKLRAVVTMAPANYNFTQPTNNHVPLAYMSTTGMSDGTCPWGDASRGGKACVIQHATDNGCTAPGTMTTTTAGSKKYLCYDYEGCKPGYPVKVCTFDGGHTPSSIDDGSSTGDDGLKAFIPPIAWKFMAQF